MVVGGSKSARECGGGCGGQAVVVIGGCGHEDVREWGMGLWWCCGLVIIVG
jgi:hypothetical protein